MPLDILHTPDELEAALGEDLKTIRLQRDLDQKTLAERAGVSLNALRNLEGGHGSTVHTLVSILRALGIADSLARLAPVATINPLALSLEAQPRQRARRRPAKTAA